MNVTTLPGMEKAVQTLAVWVHNMDPVLLPVWKNIQIRWYGLAYLMGFVMGYLLLRWMAKRKLWVLKPEKVGDFIAYAAIFGVFLGGRLGYVLFYMIPSKGVGAVLSDPLVIFRVWEGGMSSHGGILGLTVFAWFYARKSKVSWPGIGDGLVIASTLGVFFGRLANFVNGELYGRVIAAGKNVPWAMKFPKELHEVDTESFEVAMREAVAADQSRLGEAWKAYSADPGGEDARTFLLERVQEAGRENPAIMEVLGNYLNARHPSQLYQALLEGLGLCLILFLMRLRFPKMAHGIITGTFFILYATFRIVAERFREPDSAWVIENVLTKGQFYSVFMYAIGAAFLIFALRGKTGCLGEGAG